MTKSGRQTSLDYAKFCLGIDLGDAKSISVCGLRLMFDG